MAGFDRDETSQANQFRGIHIGLGGPRRPRPGAQLFIGLAIAVAGALFTLDNLDIVESEPILRWWPLVVIAFGLVRLLGNQSRQDKTLGALITGAGLLLLTGSLGLLHFGIWDLWPLVLIFAGASLVMRSFQRYRETEDGGDPADAANLFVVMGGITRRMVSGQFRGGEITAVMGGIDLDLREAKAAGDTVTLNVLVCWGGIDLKVSPEWRVVSEVMPIMAGLEDRTKSNAEVTTTLVIRGTMLMGGIEVKN